MYDGNPNAEWNQNILYNLKNQFPRIIVFTDDKILREYDDYIMSDQEKTFYEWILESI